MPIGSFFRSDNYPGVFLAGRNGVFLSASASLSLWFAGVTTSIRIPPLICDRCCPGCCIVHSMNRETVHVHD